MAVTITETALNRLESLKRRRQTPEAVLRIGVRGGGCSGLSTSWIGGQPRSERQDLYFSGWPSGGD